MIAIKILAFLGSVFIIVIHFIGQAYCNRKITGIKELGQAAQEAADAADDMYQSAMKSIDTYNYTKRNLTKITSHHRKSSSSWARTGILFKNK